MMSEQQEQLRVTAPPEEEVKTQKPKNPKKVAAGVKGAAARKAKRDLQRAKDSMRAEENPPEPHDPQKVEEGPPEPHHQQRSGGAC